MGLIADLVSKGFDPSSEEVEWRDLAEYWGISTSNKDAMAEATFYTCTKILRETLGKLPPRLMRSREDGIQTCDKHALYSTLCLRPNPYFNSTSFWSAVEQRRIVDGNAYVWIQRFRDGRTYLWLLPTGDVQVWWDQTRPLSEVEDIYYIWSSGSGIKVLKSYEVMHFRWSDTSDGITGIPLFSRLKSLVSGSVEAQKFQNDLISSGLTAKAVMQYSADLSDKSVTDFTALVERYANGQYAGKGVKNIIPIPVGTTLQPLNTKLTDAQFEELKKYSAAQIAAAFGIKPQQINDMTKQSYASSQAQQEAFYQDTMLYTIRAYEDEITYKLLDSKMLEESYFVQFDTTVMLRSDYKTQVEANSKAINFAQMTPNESRKRLNLPPMDGGDVLLCNGNLVPIGMVGMQKQGNLPKGGENE